MDNYTLIEKLQSLGFEDDNIYNFIIRKDTSPMVKNLLDQIVNIDDLNSIHNIILKLFFVVDKMKPISCD